MAGGAAACSLAERKRGREVLVEGIQISVREAQPGDEERLSRMRYEFRAAEDPAMEPQDDFLDRCSMWMRARLDSEEERWRCWVAEDGSRIVGHVWMQLVPKIPNPTREAEMHAYLTNNYVEPERRDGGIGSALLQAAVGWCRQEDIDSVILWPTDDSRSLYRRFGFERTDDVFELCSDAVS